MQKILIFAILVVFTNNGCNEEEIINNIIDSRITAKEKLPEVLEKARTDFALDAKLSAIYGREVSTEGEIDLSSTVSLNAFIYVMQSDQQQSNEFYVPVFGAGPVRSPVNFTTMLSFIKDTTASNIMGAVFGKLSTASIDPNATFDDSPQIVSRALNAGGSAFMNQNAGTKIDMFLVPGKSIDTTLTVTNTADWVVNFYSADRSLVLWLRENDVITLSGN